MPRVEVLRWRSETTPRGGVRGGRHDRSQAVVTVCLPLHSFLDSIVVNAYLLH